MDKKIYLVYSQHGFSEALRHTMYRVSDCLFYKDDFAFVRTEESARSYWEKYLSKELIDNFITEIEVGKEKMNMWGIMNKKVWKFLGIETEAKKDEKDEHSTGGARQQEEGNDRMGNV